MTLTSTGSAEDDVIFIDRDDISNYNPEQILPEPVEELRKIRKWLNPTNYTQKGGEFHKHLQSHMPGTGEWLIAGEEFQTWLKSDEHGLLWVKGIPGSGKSVLAAHIIDYLSHLNAGRPCLYFFFRQIIDANHQPAALLRDWLDQILEYSPPLQQELKGVAKDIRSIGSLSMDDLWRYLRLALRSLPGQAFCVADALDEMDSGNAEFLRSLAAFGQWKPSKVKVMLTSRPTAAIEDSLRKVKMLRLRLEEKLVDIDISNYVEHGLRQLANISADEQNQIRGAVPGRANGIFLYAKLAMDAFLEPGAKVAQVLHTLPVDLHELYTRLLREHEVRSGVPHDTQLLILQWVTHATRPLRLIELAEMLSATGRPTGNNIAQMDLASAKSLVRAAAGPLLEILPNHTVCVIHHSFTEYLKCMTRSESDGGFPVLALGATHENLALACLKYLESGCLDTIDVTGSSELKQQSWANDWYEEDVAGFRIDATQGRNKQEKQRTKLRHPFFAYAASNWQLHVARSCAAGYVQNNLNIALHRIWGIPRYIKAWSKHVWYEFEEDHEGISCLHIAARYGLLSFAESILSKGVDIDAKDNHGKTSLWWAADSGHASMIQLLVSAGADPDVAENARGLKPIHQAATNNHAEAIRALLEAGVDPLTGKTHDDRSWGGCTPRSSTKGETALMYACKYGHLEALKAFLPFLKGVDVLHEALSWSAQSRHSKLVQCIIQQPAVDINAKVYGYTPLHRACESRDRDTIEVLLDTGADPNILCTYTKSKFGDNGSQTQHPEQEKDEKRGSNALMALFEPSSRDFYGLDKPTESEIIHELFKLLIARGARVNQRSDRGQTLLHIAVNHPVLVRLLLSTGVDANVADDTGLVPLHIVQTTESLKLLVDVGKANIDAINSYNGLSPLCYMLGCNSEGIIMQMMDYGPNLSIKDAAGNGLLHMAISRCCEAGIIRMLLAAGVNPNERNHAGETALLLMSMPFQNQIDMLDILLEAGADINAKDRSGMTVLSRLISSSSTSIEYTKKLIGRGADVHTRNNEGKTLLHHAVAKHFGADRNRKPNQKDKTILELLLQHDLNVQAVDYGGNTLLHELALNCVMLDSSKCGNDYVPLFQHLLDLGVDINQGNHQGRTVLHFAAARLPWGASPKHMCGLFTPLDLILQQVKDVDQKDFQGLTALHLSTTVSEYMTMKLLQAGADRKLRSLEDLSPLHLAARARQSNIIGLLLGSGRCTAPFVDLRDKRGRTALFYACQSGIPEIVTMLLAAGAKATEKLLFEACAGFEEEQRLWFVDHHPTHTKRNQAAGGLSIDDTSRPPKPREGHTSTSDLDLWKYTPRLEEIVDLLVAHGCDTSDIRRLAAKSPTYTCSCLLRALEIDKPSGEQRVVMKAQPEFRERLVKAAKGAYIDAALLTLNSADHLATQSMIVTLLEERQYHVMKRLFENGVDFLSMTGDFGSQSIMKIFIDHGYVSLVDEIGHLEAKHRLTAGEWHASGSRSEPGLYRKTNPMDKQEVLGDKQHVLLLDAVKRVLPNMEVIRLLVESFNVDINQYRYRLAWGAENLALVAQENALHHLAKGLHWWHVSQAMPYLISRGADLNAKNEEGLSPLEIAICEPGQYTGMFNLEAVRTLLAAGANPNAQNSGYSCLSRSIYNVAILKLLIDHGALIDARSVLEAVREKRIDALKALLTAGADPNRRIERRPPSKDFRGTNTKSFSFGDILEHEIYPLYVAATNYKEKGYDEAVQSMEALLSAGADPHATFRRRISKHGVPMKDTELAVAEILLVQGTDEEYEEVTILHDLLEHDHLVHPILSISTLDPNRRDTKGRTITHMMCHSHSLFEPIDSVLLKEDENFVSCMPSFLDCVVKQGADLLATDHSGRNVLHHMFENNRQSHQRTQSLSGLTQLIEKYPSLLNQADAAGKTPLHLAAKHGVFQRDFAAADILLKAGADPFALDIHGNNCLHIVAFCIYKSKSAREFFTELVNRGLDINAKNHRGETPVFNLNRRYISNVRTMSEGEHAILAKEALSLFENAGADLFAKDNSGRGLLHIIAKEIVEVTYARYATEKHEKTEPPITRFQVLLHKGLDPLMEDEEKRTALDVAAAYGKESILKLFEKE